MPRRKQHTLLAINLPCYKTIVEDLSKLPELAEGYDMGSIKISAEYLQQLKLKKKKKRKELKM